MLLLRVVLAMTDLMMISLNNSFYFLLLKLMIDTNIHRHTHRSVYIFIAPSLTRFEKPHETVRVFVLVLVIISSHNEEKTELPNHTKRKRKRSMKTNTSTNLIRARIEDKKIFSKSSFERDVLSIDDGFKVQKEIIASYVFFVPRSKISYIMLEQQSRSRFRQRI